MARPGPGGGGTCAWLRRLRLQQPAAHQDAFPAVPGGGVRVGGSQLQQRRARVRFPPLAERAPLALQSPPPLCTQPPLAEGACPSPSPALRSEAPPTACSRLGNHFPAQSGHEWRVRGWTKRVIPSECRIPDLTCPTLLMSEDTEGGSAEHRAAGYQRPASSLSSSWGLSHSTVFLRNHV